MTCSGRGPAAMRCPGARGRRGGAVSGSLRRWPACGPRARAGRPNATPRRRHTWTPQPPGRRRRARVPAVAQAQAAQLRLERAGAARRTKVAAGEQRRAEEEAAGVRRGPGGSKPPLPAGAHSKVRKARAGLEQARVRAAEAERKAAQEQGNGPGPVRNITDPDARLMPVRGGGFIEGCNTQNAGSEDGLIIAAELTQDTTGTAWFEPMLHQAQDAAALITAQRAAAREPHPARQQPRHRRQRSRARVPPPAPRRPSHHLADQAVPG
jgi:hypothetical protein